MTHEPVPINSHSDVTGGHRFPGVVYKGEPWDLSHLDPFAFRAVLSDALSVDVVVLFSCHCFTHGRKRDERDDIPADEYFWEGNSLRILSPERYHLSRQFLPEFIRQLGSRHIKVVGGAKPNFFSFETVDRDGRHVYYSVFFEVYKDARRKRRILLRVQTAYALDALTQRLANARKVNLPVLLRAVYEGRPIRA